MDVFLLVGSFAPVNVILLICLLFQLCYSEQSSRLSFTFFELWNFFNYA